MSQEEHFPEEFALHNEHLNNIYVLMNEEEYIVWDADLRRCKWSSSNAEDDLFSSEDAEASYAEGVAEGIAVEKMY